MVTAIPHENDVLFGKGTTINQHPGNQRLRDLVEPHKEWFQSNKKKREERQAIAKNIISHIHHLQPPGRFLIEDPSAATASHAATLRTSDDGGGNPSSVHPSILRKVWVCVEYDKAFDKVMHKLREKDKGDRGSAKKDNQGEKTIEDHLQTIAAAIEGIQSINDNATSAVAIRQTDGSYDDRKLCSHDVANITTEKFSCPEELDRKFNSELGRHLNLAGNGEDGLSLSLSLCHSLDDESDFQRLITENNCLEDESKFQESCAFEEGAMTPQERGTDFEPIHHLNNSQLPDSDGEFNSFLDQLISNEKDELDATDQQADRLNGPHDLHVGLVAHPTDPDLGLKDEDATEQQLLEHTLRQWTDRSKSKKNGFIPSNGQSFGYVKLALPVALKLTEFLIQAEKDNDIIPLESINAGNVLIRARRVEEGDDETVDFVWVMSSLGENPAAGTVSSRLCAVGVIFYELFGAEEPLEDMTTSNPSSVGGINLNNEAESTSIHDQRSQHKYQRQSSSLTGDKVSTCVARLESKGLPWSICNLVKNLLECSKGDYCGDDAYSSLFDLKEDLSLMLDNPSRFLEDIHVPTLLSSLEICDKLYGREDEKAKLDKIYQEAIRENSFRGVIISGGAGVGKSRLAIYIQELTNHSSGYFCASKFEQNQMSAKPLATIGTVFNELCESFAKGATEDQLELVEKELETGLGSQASLFCGVVPNLTKLLPSCVQRETASCIDVAVSMRYLFGELLRVIASHSRRPISIFLDDIQFADAASLLVFGNLLFTVKNSSLSPSILIAFSYREEEGQFKSWLDSLSMFSMEGITLKNLSADSVNCLISETLHASPRITRPLSAVLHHKTRGNPLFLRQLLGSLHGQGLIYADLSQRRWAWDMNKITQHPISSSVLALLIKEMEQLHPDLQLGLGVASCLGSCIQKDVLKILSCSLGLDLIDILQRVSEKGFMSSVDGGVMFRFAHDKIQQAAYELKSKQHRRENHYQYGRALYAPHSGNSAESNALFLTSITQMNNGGPDVVHDPSQMGLIAAMNFKAGRLAIKTDYASAFWFFQHGVSYLAEDHWSSNYELSVNLYDAVVETACALNKHSVVQSFTEELVNHARSFDDSLYCLSFAAKSLHHAQLYTESMESKLGILASLGEKPLRDIGDNTLSADMDAMNEKLKHWSDELICSMQDKEMKKIVALKEIDVINTALRVIDTALQSRSNGSSGNLQKDKTKKLFTLQRLYCDLAHVLHFVKPGLLGSVSLRMVELTLSDGITPTTPLAFAYYGETLTATGKISDGCRLGRLALKLVQEATSHRHMPNVIILVYQTILWHSEPLQAITDAHHLGYKVGQQVGDSVASMYNLYFYHQMNYLSGQSSLCTVQTNVKEFIQSLVNSQEEACTRIFIPPSVLLYYHVIALRRGQMLGASRVDNIPTEAEIEISDTSSQSENAIMRLMRTFYFRQFNSDTTALSNFIAEMKMVLRPALCVGVFYEGLVCFLSSVEAIDSTKSALIERGQSILAKMRSWHEYSSWNWENKLLLLEAIEMHTTGNYDAAEPLYNCSIQSSRKHKFIHEEAVASELAGDFLFEQGRKSEAYGLLMHSIKCFNEWGALAIAKRVKSNVQSKFGVDATQLAKTVNTEDSIQRILDESNFTKKRQWNN